MDRLWDVWTRKQQMQKLPWLPTGADLDTFKNEPFLFYMNAKGQPVGPRIAGDYIDMSKFDYDYEPGFGEEVVVQPNVVVASASFPGMMKGQRGDGERAGASGTEERPARGHGDGAQAPGRQCGARIRCLRQCQGRRDRRREEPELSRHHLVLRLHEGHGLGDAQFALPLPDNLQAIAANGKLDITVVPVGGVPQVGSPMKGNNTMTTAPHGTSVLKAASVTAW